MNELKIWNCPDGCGFYSSELANEFPMWVMHGCPNSKSHTFAELITESTKILRGKEANY